MNPGSFGLDTSTLAGSLDMKLQAVKAAGFSQVMLWSSELVAYPGGLEAASRLIRQSGVRVSGLQVMRDYEGLSGTLHDYKVDVAKVMLNVCRAVGAPLLIVCSSTSSHASGDLDVIGRDLAKLANLAVPLGIRIGYEALSWGRHVHDYSTAWEAVDLANHANLGVVIDSFQVLAGGSSLEGLDDIPNEKIAMVQLSDFMWREIRDQKEKFETDRHLRVFPGEGEHSRELADFVRRLYRAGYRGDYSFEVFNDDYLQMPPAAVVEHARRATTWVTSQVLRRGLQLRDHAYINGS